MLELLLDKIPKELLKYFKPKRKYGAWIKRRTKIWQKPNFMPSSVKDDMTNDFEYIYFFVKSKNYWFEQVFEEYKTLPENRNTKTCGNKNSPYAQSQGDKAGIHAYGNGEQGRNKRAVWTISTKPFKEAHFATFPEDLIEPMIQAGCPRYVCKKCGKARGKIYEYKGGTIGKSWHNHSKDLEEGMHQSLGGLDKQGEEPYQRVDVGYSDCGCNAGFEPGVVLDPFGGALTTCVVAKKQGKSYIAIELKKEYIEMGKRRLDKTIVPMVLFE